jgi:RNA polymerase sigma factor (sigma-70 family)
LVFDKIFEEYKNLVFNLALKYVYDVEDAEEITQDVFVIIYQKLDNFREESKFSTWIYRITINKSIDFIRAKKRQKRFANVLSLFGDGNKVNFEKTEFNHPGILLENNENLKLLLRQINELDHNQKTVIILLKIEGKSQVETAEIMNLSIKAVESMFQRAKANLLKKINKSKDLK